MKSSSLKSRTDKNMNQITSKAIIMKDAIVRDTIRVLRRYVATRRSIGWLLIAAIQSISRKLMSEQNAMNVGYQKGQEISSVG